MKKTIFNISWFIIKMLNLIKINKFGKKNDKIPNKSTAIALWIKMPFKLTKADRCYTMEKTFFGGMCHE